MVRTHLRLAAAALTACAVVGFLAPDAEARARRRYNPRKARAPLLLISLVQDSRTDVKRNEGLIFKFSAYVRRGSLDNRSLRVAAVTPTGLKPATGALRIVGPRVRFDPTRTQRNWDASRQRNSTTVEGDNPEGFASYQDYIVEIPSPPELHTLRNHRGRPIVQGFTGDFRTNDTYFDPKPGQPSFVGDFGAGGLGFIPPRSGSTGLVDEDATVVFEFSEPIKIDTLDPSSSVTVERIAIGEKVPGFIKKDPNEPTGRRFLFVPSLGFGSDHANLLGWDVQVTLDSTVTDLAGNPLKRPVVFPIFRTRYVAGKPSASIISESFEDQDQMDPVTVLDGGEWNTVEEGSLRGGAPTTYPNQDVQYNQVGLVRTRVNDPLVSEQAIGTSCLARTNGSRAQMLYLLGDVGDRAAVVAMGWGPDSNALFGSTHPDMRLRLGHTSLNQLGTDMSVNINVGPSQLVFQGQYDIPQRANINPPGLDTGYWPWPTFNNAFELNGVNHVVLDASVDAANNCQILRIAFSAGGNLLAGRRAVAFDATTDTAFIADRVVYDMRFQKRRRTTRATSLWYEVAADDPIFAESIVSPIGQSGGVTVLVEVQGAPGKSDGFGGFVADPGRATPWTTDMTDVDGYRFVRFQISMVANLTTQQTARITSIQVPYQF